ncbi:hypothetical protein CPC16_002871 [Podila verticillata]|nr:hypothetical protein CPC16_002871 [Podila verticillata]
MSKDFEKATLKKASVNTLPLWVDRDLNSLTLSKLKDLPEEDSLGIPLQNSSSSSSKLQLSTLSTFSAPSAHSHSSAVGTSLANGATSTLSLNGSRYPSSSITGSGSTSAPLKNGSGIQTSSSQQEWSIFATMSNVPTLSSSQQRQYQSLSSSLNTITSPPTSPTVPSQAAQTFSSLKRLPQKLDEIFKSKATETIPSNSNNNSINSKSTSTCTCTCPQHQPRISTGGRLGISMSKRRNRKESMEAMRGYPTGQCVSSEPPPETNWDEKEVEELLPEEEQQQGFFANNTAFNLKALKNFLKSPVFSNFLKSLTIMASVSLFAIALDAIVILVKAPDQQTQLSNDNAALIVTVILSILTIFYSCFTIFLESRRPPEGLDTSNSKPLIVIFSEIVASIVWAQVLSVTIYIYIWTYGCTEAGHRQLDQLWKLEVADRHLTDKLCRRQGAMVGLELLLVLLLIFNFYTHLEINFRFARSMR